MSGNKTLERKVVGLTFVDGYPDNLHELHAMIEGRKRDTLGWGNDGDGNSGTISFDDDPRLPVTLRRNPANEHDANAIEVHVPVLGRGKSMIGHIDRHTAARLAPSMDRGDVWKAVLATVLIDPEHDDKPGALVNIECVQRATQDA